MSATATQGQTQAGSDTIKATQGGTGTVPAWSEPRIQYSAPAGIAQLTPQNHILAAGKNLSIATGQDTNLIAQGNHSLAVKAGIALFTVGKANGKNKPMPKPASTSTPQPARSACKARAAKPPPPPTRK